MESIQPLGYAWLREHFSARSAPSYHRSYLGTRRETRETEGFQAQIFPKSYLHDDSPIGHLLFGLKYDGLDLALLAELLPQLPRELEAAVAAKPTSKGLRQLWFLYEWLTGERLDLRDSVGLTYTPAADPTRYYTLPKAKAQKSRRHGVLNNLLGTPEWSPLVRRTPTLAASDRKPLGARARQVVGDYPPEFATRALSYLYAKETKTSWAIEREEPKGRLEQRFVAVLHQLDDFKRLDRQTLVGFQNAIVGPKCREADYRRIQNHIGYTDKSGTPQVSYIPPRPEDVPAQMAGLGELADQLTSGFSPSSAPVPPVVAAAAVSFSFVYIHPFEDGNGRLHRLLIHHVLARLGFTSPGMTIPVSAAILSDRVAYDQLLTAVDQALMPHLAYDFDDDNNILVRGNDPYLYAYLDLTPHAEALYRWTEQAIEVDLVDELRYLTAYERAKRRIRTIVELPDRDTDRLITLCRDHNFRLSQTKRRRFFPCLEDHEVTALEAAVEQAFNNFNLNNSSRGVSPGGAEPAEA